MQDSFGLINEAAYLPVEPLYEVNPAITRVVNTEVRGRADGVSYPVRRVVGGF